MRRRAGRLLPLLGAVACAALLELSAGPAGAAVVDMAAKRAALASQRVQADADHAAELARCQQRFVVTACLKTAEHQHRQALGQLRHQQLLLDEMQRQQRATERLQSIEHKRSAAASTVEAAVAQPVHNAKPDDAWSAPLPAVRPLRPAGRTKPPTASQLPQAALIQDHVRAQQARQVEMQAHRQAVERRNARRAAQGKRAAPLPVPAASALPTST